MEKENVVFFFRIILYVLKLLYLFKRSISFLLEDDSKTVIRDFDVIVSFFLDRGLFFYLEGVYIV